MQARRAKGKPMSEEFTVFVVDDNAGVRKSLKNLCDAEGLAVEAYASSDEFLAAYDLRRRGCLLLDVRLPGSDGLDLQDELRRRKAKLPTIVMTAYANVPTSVRAFKGGAVDFLQKPISPEALLERIRHLIEIDRQEREAAAPRNDVLGRMASLTPRERQVMDMLVDGLISKEIAFNLGVSTRTIEGHRREVLRKMGVTSAAQLVRVVMSARD
jgi:FixJ family two-component response regulator